MNEEELEKLKELFEKIKRMGEFQTVNSKKTKPEASSSIPLNKGKTVQQTVPVVQQTTFAQQAKQQQKAQQALKNPQIQRTFATATVRDWYNKELLEHDPEIYEKLNGCHRAVQSADMR